MSCRSRSQAESLAFELFLRRMQELAGEFRLHNRSLVGMDTAALEEHLSREEWLIRELLLHRTALRKPVPANVAAAASKLLREVRTHAALIDRSRVSVRALMNTIASCNRDQMSYGNP